MVNKYKKKIDKAENDEGEFFQGHKKKKKKNSKEGTVFFFVAA